MKKRLSVLIRVLACVGLSFVFFVIPARAQLVPLYTVNTTSDTVVANACFNGAAGCSLRGAILESNTDSNSVIAFAIFEIRPIGGFVINLTQALPAISAPVSIEGPGADNLTVKPVTGGQFRVFNVTTAGTVFFFGLTISNGVAAEGGGIQNSMGTVNVINCTLSNNTVTGNSGSRGGGIVNFGGTLNVTNSTISNNSNNGGSGGGGGGIYNEGTLNLTNSTISNNSSSNTGGGGIINFSGTANVTNSTISGNQATSSGTGGGISNSSGTVNVKNSIIALNTTTGIGPDVGGNFVSAGFNLIGKTDGGFGFTAATDQTGRVASPLDPKLDPLGLQNNGGPTQTIALQPGSPAIDKGTSAGLTGNLTTDQRGTGFPRTINDPLITNATGGNGTDIGAFEKQTITPTLQFSSATYSVNENAGTATINVTRANDPSVAATVNYATSNGTATAGADYTATSGTLSFASGDTSKTFSVPIINDSLNEINETVNLTLSNVTGNAALGTPSTAVLTIVDDDPLPGLSINDVSVAEGNSGTTNANFTVSLSAASGQTVTVNFASANGTATAGSDYVATSGTLTFTAGQTTKPVTVTVNGDTTVELDETFFVDLSSPANATLTRSRGTGTITNDDAAPMTIQFSASLFIVGEGDQRVNLTVMRSGNTSGASSVGFATNDAAGLTNCNVFNGVASPRCDFINTIGTMQFSAGETSKSFSVAVINDSYAEGTENFTVSLNNPSGATLGAQSTTTVMIVDNETTTGPNPIDNTNFFVRQQYLDFLGREPDSFGFPIWVSTINNCAPGDTSCDRIHVSQQFFQSAEFQERGYFVYRFYDVAFGRKPDYDEFVVDLAGVSGFLDNNQLEAAKVAFIAGFMARAAFANTYNGLTNQQYVDRLLNTAGVMLGSRQSMIDGLNNSTLTRAVVLRQIVESSEVSTKFNHEAYAVMEYFGYLRRQPDIFYLDWIAELDRTNNPRGMVTGFVNSQEYRQRFGP